MDKLYETVKGDPLCLLVHFFSDVLEKLLNDHGIFKFQLREAIVHQSFQIDSCTFNFHMAKVLQVARRLSLLLFFHFLLFLGGYRGGYRRWRSAQVSCWSLWGSSSWPCLINLLLGGCLCNCCLLCLITLVLIWPILTFLDLSEHCHKGQWAVQVEHFYEEATRYIVLLDVHLFTSKYRLCAVVHDFLKDEGADGSLISLIGRVKFCHIFEVLLDLIFFLLSSIPCTLVHVHIVTKAKFC